MSCRAEGCEAREWMARKFCDRHWKMLPTDLQMQIRIALNKWKESGIKGDLDELLARATGVITEKEVERDVAAQVGLFRTHMASVAGTVAALRTIPLRDLHEQLARSAESQLRTDPAGHAEVAQRVELDLALLEILADTSDKLRETIKRFAPPAPAEVGE